jgi:uncharacterized protein (TIGR02246 family)
MRIQVLTLALIGCGLLMTGCGETPVAAPDTREADAKAIRDNEEAWNKDFESKDAAKLVAHYTDDATLMTPGMPPAIGKAAIEKGFEEMVADPALSLKFQARRVEVSRTSDMAYTEGSFTMVMTNPMTKKPENAKGSYVTVYKKQADGSWKAVSDIATSETPMEPPPDAGKKK